jgi:hypothetical protein
LRVPGRDELTDVGPIEYPASRRRVLIAGLTGAAALAVAGCRPTSPGASANGNTPSPRVIDGVLAAALALAGQYDAAIAAQPSLSDRLTPLRADHWTHVTALAKAAGRGVPSASPSPAASAATGFESPAAALRTLRAAEKSAQADAVQACIAAPAANAPLLGSVAACRATHQEVLT